MGGPIDYLEALMGDPDFYRNELYLGCFFAAAALVTQTEAQDLVFCGSS